MTIYNHQNYLEQSIRSVLKQTYKNWELIACENGSVDNSKSILRKIKDKRIKKFFFKNNIGRTKCLNFALKKSKGELIAILDSDDIAKPNRFISQINYLKNKILLSIVESLMIKFFFSITFPLSSILLYQLPTKSKFSFFK